MAPINPIDPTAESNPDRQYSTPKTHKVRVPQPIDFSEVFKKAMELYADSTAEDIRAARQTEFPPGFNRTPFNTYLTSIQFPQDTE